MADNTPKNRKSASQEIYEQADNAGRFAGNDIDAQSARKQAEENIKSSSQSSRQELDPIENTDAEARRDPSQVHDLKEEAQNINDDTGRPLNEEETGKARNKSNEGLRQGRERT
jgi:hypothetical protein